MNLAKSLIKFSIVIFLTQIITSENIYAEVMNIESLVQKVKNNQSLMQRCHCVTEARSARDAQLLRESKQAMEEKHGVPPVFYYDEKAIEQGEGMVEHIRTQEVLFDDTGRKKITTTYQHSEERKTKSYFQKHTFVWNGEHNIIYTKTGDKPGGATISAEKTQMMEFGGQPWDTFNGYFLKQAEKALENSSIINVTEEDGIIKTEFINDKWKYVTYLDSNNDYNVVRQEKYYDDKILALSKAEYRKINNIWFPYGGTIEVYFIDHPGKLKSLTIYETKEIQINDCSFNDADFEVTFENGTLVQDLILGLTYIYGNPLSYRVIGTGVDKDIQEVVDKELEDVGKSSEWRQIRLPKVIFPCQQKSPCVLDLSSGAMFDANGRETMESLLKLLVEEGRGDIIWDGRIVAARGAVLAFSSKEQHDRWKVESAERCNYYSLTKMDELPCQFYIVTGANQKYNVKLISIDKEGITLSYHKESLVTNK